METQRPRELPIIGGHLALDFANTVDDPLGPARHDHVSSYDGLVRWALRVGTLEQRQGATLLRAARRREEEVSAALIAAHQLRDSLNAAFGAVISGTTVPPRAWRRLRDLAADAQASARLVRQENGWAWAWPGAGELTVVLFPIAAAAADLLVSPEVSRVKQCARCPWLFLDVSKNQSRRWCDMNDCGRAQKIELYVARRAARRAHRTG